MLPGSVDELTPSWLSDALGVRIDSVHRSTAAGGVAITSDVARLILTGQDRAPPSLVAKVVNPKWQHGLDLQRREDRFYRELAANHPLPVPQCFFSALEGDRFVLLLEDLTDAVPGHRLTGCSLEEAERVLRTVGDVHRAWWGGDRLADWPRRDYDAEKIESLATRFEGCWPRFLEQAKYPVSQAVIDAVEGLPQRLYSGMDRLQSGPRTLIHADLHAENLLYDGDRVVVLDWQNAALGHPAFDVAGMVMNNPSPALQRSSARSLVAAYHAHLGCPWPLEELEQDVAAAVGWLFAGTVYWLVAFEAEGLRDAQTVQNHWGRVSTGLTVWSPGG